MSDIAVARHVLRPCHIGRCRCQRDSSVSHRELPVHSRRALPSHVTCRHCITSDVAGVSVIRSRHTGNWRCFHVGHCRRSLCLLVLTHQALTSGVAGDCASSASHRKLTVLSRRALPTLVMSADAFPPGTHIGCCR